MHSNFNKSRFEDAHGAKPLTETRQTCIVSVSLEEKGEGTTGHLTELRKEELQYSQQVFGRKWGGPGQEVQLKIRGGFSQSKCILGHRTEESPLRAGKRRSG